MMQDPGSARARGQWGACGLVGGAFSNPLLLRKEVGGGGEPPLEGKNELDLVIPE